MREMGIIYAYVRGLYKKFFVTETNVIKLNSRWIWDIIENKIMLNKLIRLFEWFFEWKVITKSKNIH